jgi:hypothetical protein
MEPLQSGNWAFVPFITLMVSCFDSSKGEATRHNEMWIRLKHFLTSNWENLHEEVFLRAQTLTTNSSLMFPLQHDLLVHKLIPCNFVFGCVKEYFWTSRTLAPFSHGPTPFETTSTFTTFHLQSDGFFPIFFKDYEPNQDLEFFSNSFKLTFQCMSHLSTRGHFWMVFEHLQMYFQLKDSTNGFP